MNDSEFPEVYGKCASDLRKGRFLLNSEVTNAIGTPVEYVAWSARQACLVSIAKPAVFWPIKRKTESGMTIQPDFYGIPLAQELCMQLEEGAMTFKSLLEYYFILTDPTDEEVDEWIAKAATENLHNWAWYALKTRLGFEHWNEVPPKLVNQWAKENRILSLFPKCYRVPE